VAPFVWVGATLGGTQGIMAGYGLGVVGFGAIGIWLCFKTLDRLGTQAV